MEDDRPFLRAQQRLAVGREGQTQRHQTCFGEESPSLSRGSLEQFEGAKETPESQRFAIRR